jgi:tetratricopeptide (TPR) repeat protein
MRIHYPGLLLILLIGQTACTSVSVSRRPGLEPFPEPRAAGDTQPQATAEPRAVTRPVAPPPVPPRVERDDSRFYEEERPQAATAPAAEPAVPSLPPPEAPAAQEEKPATGFVPSAAPPPIMALRDEARTSLQAGDLDNAAAALERAIRIQPKNGELWHQLAEVRLKQEQPGLAEELAQRSNLHAHGNADLIRANWAIIAEARSRKGDSTGAAEAAAKALQ